MINISGMVPKFEIKALPGIGPSHETHSSMLISSRSTSLLPKGGDWNGGCQSEAINSSMNLAHQ